MSILGSKGASGAYQAIIASMPAHDTYVELFLGAGAIMKRKPRSAIDIGIELDPITYAAAKRNLESSCGSTQIIHGCAFEFLDELIRTYNRYSNIYGRLHIYADPPYLWSTRTSDKRYEFEFDQEDHERLLDRLKTLTTMNPGKITAEVSGYPSSLYDSLLPDWRSYEFQVMTRGGVRTEKLWMSYDQNTVHWHDYAGSDFTGRQRIKRKAQRWAKNYAAMCPGERCAVLAAMLEHSSDIA